MTLSTNIDRIYHCLCRSVEFYLISFSFLSAPVVYIRRSLWLTLEAEKRVRCFHPQLPSPMGLGLFLGDFLIFFKKQNSFFQLEIVQIECRFQVSMKEKMEKIKKWKIKFLRTFFPDFFFPILNHFRRFFLPFFSPFYLNVAHKLHRFSSLVRKMNKNDPKFQFCSQLVISRVFFSVDSWPCSPTPVRGGADEFSQQTLLRVARWGDDARLPSHLQRSRPILHQCAAFSGREVCFKSLPSLSNLIRIIIFFALFFCDFFFFLEKICWNIFHTDSFRLSGRCSGRIVRKTWSIGYWPLIRVYRSATTTKSAIDSCRSVAIIHSTGRFFFIIFARKNCCFTLLAALMEKVEYVVGIINQPINQSSHVSTVDQSINQSIKPGFNRRTNQSINRSSQGSTVEPINQSIDQAMVQPLNQSINQSIKPWFNRWINQSIKPWFNCCINQSIDQAVDFTLILEINYYCCNVFVLLFFQICLLSMCDWGSAKVTDLGYGEGICRHSHHIGREWTRGFCHSLFNEKKHLSNCERNFCFFREKNLLNSWSNVLSVRKSSSLWPTTKLRWRSGNRRRTTPFMMWTWRAFM